MIESWVTIPAVAFSSSAVMTMPARLKRSSAAKLRLSRTDIGSINPSVLRSSGTRAMPMSSRFAALGLPTRTDAAAEPHLALHAAQHAEQREEELALALAVEPAEADDLARPCREVDRRAGGRSTPAHAPRAPVSAPDRRVLRRRFGRERVFDVAADHHLDGLRIGLACRATKVATCWPLRNTEQSSASSAISFIRCEM